MNENTVNESTINENIPEMFPIRLHDLRLERRFSQKDLADMLGITLGAICQYEQRRRTPNFAILIAMANALNTNVDYLLGNNDIKEKLPRTQNEVKVASNPLVLGDEKYNAETKARINEMLDNLEPEKLTKVLHLIETLMHTLD